VGQLIGSSCRGETVEEKLLKRSCRGGAVEEKLLWGS